MKFAEHKHDCSDYRFFSRSGGRLMILSGFCLVSVSVGNGAPLMINFPFFYW